MFMQQPEHYPRTNRRNWGEYIDLLTKADSGPDLIDLFEDPKDQAKSADASSRKAGRGEAIDLFCICQAVNRSVGQGPDDSIS